MTASRQTEHAIDPLFTERWSSRAFTSEAIDEPTLRGLLEAARWAPSASNSQPWRFIYARAGTPAWSPLFQTLVPFNQAWAVHAAALVLVLSRTQWQAPGKDTPQPLASHAFDAGAAWASLAFQAHLSGWVTHAMGGFDQAAARSALGIPADHALHAVVAIGRRGDKTTLPEALQEREQPNLRLPLAAVAAEGRFSFEA